MLSTRAIQIKKDEETFSPGMSEKILALNSLYQVGTDVFGSLNNFSIWMDAENYSMGGIKPKSYLDLMVGID